MSLRPFFPFYGSKWNTARYYPPPAPGLVVEPFAGSAGYATFHGVERAHLIDADPVIVSVWTWLLRAMPWDVLALPDLMRAGDSVDDHPGLDPGARALIGFWLNRGSAVPKLSRTAFSTRTDRAQLNWSPRAKQRIADNLHRIAGWTVALGTYSDAPESPTTFVDPPYAGKAGSYYRKRFDGHGALGAWCRARRGRVIVAEGAGADWLPFAPLGSFKSTRGRSAEVVWTAGE